jgi:hypothetical protein
MKEIYKIDETNHCGSCPECGHNWDRGNVLDVIIENDKANGIETTREEAIKRAKRIYGWSEENQKRMSNLIFIELSDGDYNATGMDGYYQCGNCQVAWHSESGERSDKFKVMLTQNDEMKAQLAEILAKNKKNL